MKGLRKRLILLTTPLSTIDAARLLSLIPGETDREAPRTPMHHHDDYFPFMEIALLPLMLVSLLLAACCCIRYHRQQGHGDEEATVPDDDSLSMVSI
jgi:hypothetical protein